MKKEANMGEIQLLVKKQGGKLALCLQVLLPAPKSLLLKANPNKEKEDKT